MKKLPLLFVKQFIIKKKVKQITDMSYYGKQIEQDITDNYGIHQALVGDKKIFVQLMKMK